MLLYFCISAFLHFCICVVTVTLQRRMSVVSLAFVVHPTRSLGLLGRSIMGTKVACLFWQRPDSRWQQPPQSLCVHCNDINFFDLLDFLGREWSSALTENTVWVEPPIVFIHKHYHQENQTLIIETIPRIANAMFTPLKNAQKVPSRYRDTS